MQTSDGQAVPHQCIWGKTGLSEAGAGFCSWAESAEAMQQLSPGMFTSLHRGSTPKPKE